MVAKDTSRPTVIPGRNIKTLLEGSRAVEITGESRAETNIASTSSFFYDPPTLGLKSTQQLNVDWSKFENHTFFNSAEVNVNVAFDQIINKFPFDGTRREYEIFFERLTGFERWVYDQFPKHKGFLRFRSGSHIVVSDYAGAAFPELSKNKSGKNILDPGLNSFTLEMHLQLPISGNGTQVISQKLSGSTQGFSLFLKPTSTTGSCELAFAIVSGSTYLVTSATLEKGPFQHVCAIYDRFQSKNKLSILINEVTVAESERAIKMGAFDIKSVPFYIGSGSLLSLGTTSFTPEQTLTGSIDEFRFFHKARTHEQIQNFARKTLYSVPELKLYFKFNEPPGIIGLDSNDSLNRLVLDNSGNSLHSYISSTGFDVDLRNSGSLENPMFYERLEQSPVLFPNFTQIRTLNQDLLLSASIYDHENPNLITRLVPSHYFQEGQAFEGLETENGTINEAFSGENIPGSGKLGTTQLLLSFLYIWAKFFDELKLYIDAFSTLKYVNYDKKNTAPDHFLPIIMKQMGFTMPPFFLDASIEQYIDGENIQPTISNDEHSLQYVQNQIIRRVLTNIQEIIKSKGTQHSIKAFLRSIGIDPNNSFKIREFGGPTKNQLMHSRESRLVSGQFLDLYPGGYIVSPFLSSSRTEVGFPGPDGTMQKLPGTGFHGISNNKSDGLFTSGSWTFEAAYKWPVTKDLNNLTQSLVQMYVTGSSADSQGLILNLLAITGASDVNPRIKAWVRPSHLTNAQNAPTLEMELSGVNVFDGKIWHVFFGRTRNDVIKSDSSSSFFLSVGTQENGNITKFFSSRSLWLETGASSRSNNLFERTSSLNVSGSWLQIGSASIITSTASFLNNTSLVPDEARATQFNGQVSHVRFWSKDLTDVEVKEHIRNFQSLGVQDPTVNFNFEKTRSGSWGRLRCDITMEQEENTPDSSAILKLFDYSQNGNHFTGHFVSTSQSLFRPTLWAQSYISPSFDEAVTNEKVRVRSYQNYAKVQETPWAEVAPVYRINPSETPTDDTRFSIEFSIIDALNHDMVLIFATLESLDNALGNPELVFSPDYPSLESMREIYFNRLTDKVNIKAFFEFFRWFDTSIGSFIEQLVPRKTKFFGTNFVIESHMLERPKFEYNYNDIYLGESERHNQKATLLVQQIVGVCKKY